MMKINELNELLSIYGLQMQLCGGHALFINDEIGQLETSYHKNIYDPNSKSIKLTEARKLLDGRDFNATGKSEKLDEYYSLSIIGKREGHNIALYPISIYDPVEILHIEEEKNIEDSSAKEIITKMTVRGRLGRKAHNILFREETSKNKNGKYKPISSIFIDVDEYDELIGDGRIYVSDKQCNQSIIYLSKDQNTNEIEYSFSSGYSSDLSLEDTINLIDSTITAKKVMRILCPKIYALYEEMCNNRMKSEDPKDSAIEEELRQIKNMLSYSQMPSYIPNHIAALNAKYARDLHDLTGDLDNMTDVDLQEKFGISLEEASYPNSQVIAKVKKYLKEKDLHK